MDSWLNILIEIGFFSLLGLLYYFYQKKKILQYENNKGLTIASYILQSCLSEKNDQETPDQELDAIILALDDYLQEKAPQFPLPLLKHYAQTKACSPELKEVIEAGIAEWEK